MVVVADAGMLSAGNLAELDAAEMDLFSRKRYIRDNQALTAQENRARAMVAGAKAARPGSSRSPAGPARLTKRPWPGAWRA